MPAWPGGARPASACSSIGACTPCRPASGKARPTTASGSSRKRGCPFRNTSSFVRQFNPVKFDARAWVELAKTAGMRYIVITSKHHDGFAMYPSDLTDWCIKSTPFKRDPLRELGEACKQAGLRFCVYYSIMDWHHPDWGTRREVERQGHRHAATWIALPPTSGASSRNWSPLCTPPCCGSTANGSLPGLTSGQWPCTAICGSWTPR